MTPVVTGASGFVGAVLLGHVPVARTLSFGADDWRGRMAASNLSGATVYHLAARVHQGASEQAFIDDNVSKTELLARTAAEGGAAALVFLSSVKVNGEESGAAPFRATDEPHPEDAYARSKWAAEQALARVARETGLPVSIVRAPLVYGRGVRANLRTLLRICDTRWPLPFGALRNRRSFIEVNDLARLLLACAHDARGEARTFMASHPEPVTPARLVALIRRALGRKPRLWSVPPAMLEIPAALLGRGDTMRKLTRPLEVDARATEAALGWHAQLTLEQAVDDMVAGYREAAAT